MTRRHRSVHRVLWLLVAIVASFGFTMALVLRPSHGGEITVVAAEVPP